MPCLGVLGLGWLRHPLVLWVPQPSCKGLPFSLPAVRSSLLGHL